MNQKLFPFHALFAPCELRASDEIRSAKPEIIALELTHRRLYSAKSAFPVLTLAETERAGLLRIPYLHFRPLALKHMELGVFNSQHSYLQCSQILLSQSSRSLSFDGSYLAYEQ